MPTRRWQRATSPRRRLGPGGLLLGALLLLGGGAGCKRSDARNGRTAEPIGGPGLNVLLVSVDTTRADHLGCYGHPEVRTPNIDRLAAEGTRFAWCIASAPLTLPSHCTMLTGTYPYVHGARDNSTFKLTDENTTVAETFREAGYATHAEIAAVVLNHRYGMLQGFESYTDVSPEAAQLGAPEERVGDTAGAPPAVGETAFAPDTPEIHVERKADDITRRAADWLHRRSAGDKPFLVFLHYFDPHWPHEAPPPFAEAYQDGYLAEIAYFDEQFGKLMDVVHELGLGEKTLVILTSDHGEGRGQHGEMTHSTFLYDTTLHVPLILWCPGQVPAGQVVDTQVRLVDLVPTMLDFARLEGPPEIQGTSLLPLVVNPRRDIRLPCYADTMAPHNIYSYAWLRSLRADGWKYILGPRPELFHVAEDRLELINLANVERERAAQMRAELRETIAAAPAPPGSRAGWSSLEDDERRRLEALGYLAPGEGVPESLTQGTELDQFEPIGEDPRDHIEEIECLAAGMGAIRAAKYDEAEKKLARLLELAPNNAQGWGHMGIAHAALNRYDEAIAAFRRATVLNPRDFSYHRALGALLNLKTQYAEAEQSFREAIRLNPHDYRCHLNLGKTLAALQRFDEALPALAAARELAPRMPAVPYQQALVYGQMGQSAEALDALYKALAIDPNYVPAHAQRARELGRQGRLDEAIEHLAQAIQDNPGRPPLLYALAACYAQKGDLKQAGRDFKQAAELMPDNPGVQVAYGVTLLADGHPVEAIPRFRKALELKPDDVGALYHLAYALEAIGQLDEAEQTYARLLEQTPLHGPAYLPAASLAERRGKPQEAVALLRQGHERLPANPAVANDLAWRLATSPVDALRNGREAVELAEAAVRVSNHVNPYFLDTLAAAYAEAGRFADAVATADRALERAREMKIEGLADGIGARRALYERQQPYREK